MTEPGPLNSVSTPSVVDEYDSNTTSGLGVLKNLCVENYTTRLYNNTRGVRAHCLRVDKATIASGPDVGWWSSESEDNATMLLSVKARIPEIHSCIPNPLQSGKNWMKPKYIDMHPTFVGVHVGLNEPAPGDIINVDFGDWINKRDPKYLGGMFDTPQVAAVTVAQAAAGFTGEKGEKTKYALGGTVKDGIKTYADPKQNLPESNWGQSAILVAERELNAGAKTSGTGPNSGPFVAKYYGRDGAGTYYAWCAAFVSYCCKVAWEELTGVDPRSNLFPFESSHASFSLMQRISALCQRVPVRQGKQKDATGFSPELIAKVQPGDIIRWVSGVSDEKRVGENGHIGFVYSVEYNENNPTDGVLTTIEGNTNCGKGGAAVCKKTYPFKKARLAKQLDAIVRLPNLANGVGVVNGQSCAEQGKGTSVNGRT